MPINLHNRKQLTTNKTEYIDAAWQLVSRIMIYIRLFEIIIGISWICMVLLALEGLFVW